ncbi:cation transporter [Mycobacteroides abscessus subsp. abscessus]|nr:cation transporter [Mycobacteroides abscessus subsp. abscessus]
MAAKIGIVPDMDIAAVAAAIDGAEARVRAAVPAARIIYLEPDLYRTPVA